MRSLNLCSLSPGNCWRELVDSTKVYLPPQTSSCTANVLPLVLDSLTGAKLHLKRINAQAIAESVGRLKESWAPVWAAVVPCRPC